MYYTILPTISTISYIKKLPLRVLNKKKKKRVLNKNEKNFETIMKRK